MTKIKTVADYWDKRGATYERSWQSIAKKRLSKMETDLIETAIEKVRHTQDKKTVKVLDIGIAIGRICDAILKHDVKLHGIDVSQTMIDYCRGKYKNNPKVVEFELHDIHDPLPKNWGTFDVVSAYRVLAYTPYLKQELAIISKAMTKGGILFFTYPNKYSSMIVSRLFSGKNRLGNKLSYGNLKKILKKSDFSEFEIKGFSRLLDTLYDHCNSNFSASLLFFIENLLEEIFGPILFARMFYVVCKKK